MMNVIGKDGKEYGPVSVDVVKTWIAQGRLDAQSKAKPEGAADWLRLGELPELKDVLVPPPASMPPSSMQPLSAPAKTSGMAIASVVLGLLGLFTMGLTAVVGLVLGIIALVRINKSQGRLSGTGLAIAGTCVSGLMLLMLPIMAAMLLPALARAKQRAQSINCMNHVKQVNLALMMYATDHGDTFPPADHWCDLIKPYTGGSMDVYHCPSESGATCSYALNLNVANKKLTDLGSPGTMVLVFSSTEGWNNAGRRGAAIAHKHERGKLIVGFADGHVESVKPEDAAGLGW